MTTVAADKALTDKQVAALLGVSVDVLRQARYRPNLKAPPHFREGHRVLYWQSAALEFAASVGIERGPEFKKE